MKARRMMIFKYFLVILFLAASGCNKSSDDKPPVNQSSETLKLMTYNIHIANPPSKPGVVDIEAIVDVINQVGPDFVALQEVDRFTERSGNTLDQAKKISELTGLNYRFFKAIDRSGGEYGLAILTRFPIEKSESFSLPIIQGTGAELRVLGVVQVKLSDKNNFIFATTHLDHLADENRELQSREILKALKPYQKYPIVLGGDFNMNQSNDTWNTLRSVFYVPCTMCPPTFSATSPKTTIDYLLLNPLAKNIFTIKSYNTFSESYASDHLPLVMEAGY